ncbi:MAG: hypothetical protein CMN28_05880 [Salinisphaeraceae bacterium]|nr:hypothetical protein [Salinisphaeraceae bacterium]
MFARPVTRFGLCLLLLALAGCVTSYPVPESQRVAFSSGDALELSDTPFFPQARYQCGPAALATVLVDSGIAVTPEDLVDRVYIPALEGSLQAEMVAAARQADRLPVRIPASLDGVMNSLQAGRPVLVLLNQALPWYPAWHYAVVIGYSAQRQALLLRSGTTARQWMDLSVFHQQWQQAGGWGLVTLEPGASPNGLVLDAYMDASAAAEAAGMQTLAERAYRAGTEHWPEASAPHLGLANSLYAQGDSPAAARVLSRLLSQHPEHAVALNNLAQIRAEAGADCEALSLANRAMDLAPDGLRSEIRRTRDAIRQQAEPDCG